MADHESILANFQAITAIDDIAMAIFHLDNHNWDLQAAINSTYHDINTVENSLDNPRSNDLMNDNLDAIPTVKSESSGSSFMALNIPLREPMDDDIIETGYFPGPSTSTSSSRHNIAFSDKLRNDTHSDTTYYIIFNKIVHKITISNKCTLGDLKTRIFDETKVPESYQKLKGWSADSHKALEVDTTMLKSLSISCNNCLYLVDLRETAMDDDDVVVVPSEPLPSYQLNIRLTYEDRIITVKFQGSQTILDIKNDIYSATKIPVRYQLWHGWPEEAKSYTKLLETGFGSIQYLELISAEPVTHQTSSKNQTTNVDIDSESEQDEYEDADDEIFNEIPTPNRRKHLIDDNINDEFCGCLQFIHNYKELYGIGPNFFEGTLEGALKTACSKNAKDRKLLAIYLHHNESVLSNVFCSHSLSDETIIQKLSNSYIIFGWDMTFKSNKTWFLSSLTGCVGDSASMQVRDIPVTNYPVILIVKKYRSAYEVSGIIYGNTAKDEIYEELLRQYETFGQQIDVEIREEEERTARQMVLMEQDQAYQESLEADRAKEEAKQQKEKVLATERRRLESERAEIEAKKEAIRLEANNALPPEPEGTVDVTKIRFRKPTGEFMERKFTIQTKLKSLLNFATANGFSAEEFKVITSYPRRDLTQSNPDETLESLKLYPQETVMLEER